MSRIEQNSINKNEFLYDNCKYLKNVVYRRLSKQTELTLFAYSLTIKGRQYFRSNAGLDPIIPENETHSYLEDFFFYSILSSNWNSDASELDLNFDHQNEENEIDTYYELE